MRRLRYRSLLAPLSLSAVILLGVTACGGDDRPDNRPGADGAFGEADDCQELAREAVAGRARTVEALGDAGRGATDRIDAALDAFGGEGPDLAVRYEGLGCDRSFDEAVCAELAALEPQGPAARDLVALWRQSCSDG